MKFNGSEKQQKWAREIIESAKLNANQIDNLMRYAGPSMYFQQVMDSKNIIDNRKNLSEYANSLNRFFNMSKIEKHNVAQDASETVMSIANDAIR